MFKFKKLFFLTALVALLAAASLPASSAFALVPHNVRYALVNQASVVGNQPASFRLRGTFMCDKVQLTSAISGKVITIYAYDVNLTPNGKRCSKAQAFNRVIAVGRLVPGKYTVIVNPTNPGLQQKKFTFIEPIFFEPTLTKP